MFNGSLLGRWQMNPINSLLASALIALPVTLFAIPLARADVSYTYRGNEFTEADGHIFNTSEFVTATLVFAAPLPAATTSNAYPIFWTMNAGPNLILTIATNDPTTPYYATGTLSISITTDTTGAIEDWDVNATGPVTSPYYPPPSSVLLTISEPFTAIDWADSTEGGDGEVDDSPGTWTFRADVPEPSPFALLGAGLAGIVTCLAWERRRRHKADGRSSAPM
jgi:PEP-CTERM motif